MPKQKSADLGALSDLCTPWCIHVVATLGIANHIVDVLLAFGVSIDGE